MLTAIRWKPVAIAMLMLVVCSSCSRGPTPITQPGIDASSAGSEAMKTYDADGDGKVAGEELEKAPSLKAALPRLDANKDRGVSAEEVAARIGTWKNTAAPMIILQCSVTLDGQPLRGAKVVFEPEPFLGSEIKAAYGTTNEYGDAGPAIAPEDRPEPNFPGGVYLGLYIVRITKDENGKELIPAQYNTETTLGYEVAYDDPGVKGNKIEFALKSR
jgi:hypothetical protein